MTSDKAFSRFLSVFGMFERILYIERTDVTSPFFYMSAEGDEPICKISICNFSVLILKNQFFNFLSP